MAIGSIMAIAASGMAASQARLTATASNLANLSTPAYRPLEARSTSLAGGGVTTSLVEAGDADGDVDLAAEMTGMIESSLAMKANARMFETGASLWDLLGLVRHDKA